MHVAKLFIPIKKSWKFLATWGILWAQMIAIRIQWDLSSWKQATLMTVLAVGTILGLISVWIPRSDRKTNNTEGLYLLEALKAKVKMPWVLLFIPIIVILVACLFRENYQIFAFLSGCALSFGYSLFAGRLLRR